MAKTTNYFMSCVRLDHGGHEAEIWHPFEAGKISKESPGFQFWNGKCPHDKKWTSPYLGSMACLWLDKAKMWPLNERSKSKKRDLIMCK